MKFIIQMFIESHFRCFRISLRHCQGLSKSVAIAQSTKLVGPVLSATCAVLPSSPVLAIALLHLCALLFTEVVLSQYSALNQFAVLAQGEGGVLESLDLVSQQIYSLTIQVPAPGFPSIYLQNLTEVTNFLGTEVPISLSPMPLKKLAGVFLHFENYKMTMHDCGFFQAIQLMSICQENTWYATLMF